MAFPRYCGVVPGTLDSADVTAATSLETLQGESISVDGTTRTYLHGDPYAPAADFELTRALVDGARAKGIEPFVGQVASVDVFYNPDADYVTKWRSRGVLAFEMEAAALFYLGSRAAATGADVRGACILAVSDTLSEEETTEGTYLPLSELEAATDRMIRIALEAGTTLA